MLIEIIGIAYGIPFGKYIYNENYALIGIIGVPIYIGFAWFIIMASLYRITLKLFPMIVFILLVDILLEKFAVTQGLWTWFHMGYTDAPIQNYITWGIISVFIFVILRGSKISLFYSTLSMMFLMYYIGEVLLIRGNTFGYAGLFLALIFGILGLRKGMYELGAFR
jgi:uncharacterized membrane protein